MGLDENYLLQVRVQSSGILTEILTEFLVGVEGSDNSQYFGFSIAGLFRFLEHEQESLPAGHEVSQIHEQSAVVDVAVVAEYVLAGDIDALYFHGFE